MMHVTLGPAQVHDSITVFPLLSAAAAEPPYEVLADVLAAGRVRIGEVGQGTVPALEAVNSGARDVLVLDGEQLIGARQNRMTNRSILLPALATTEIPVSCMEQGRWHFKSDAMAPAPQHSPAKVRRRARETEVRHAEAGGTASHEVLREAQGEVWEGVEELVASVGGDSPTGALDRAYAANAERLASLERAFPAVPRQVGLLVLVGGAVIGLDVVGGRALYGRLHARLLRGYLMDALDRA
ncbi:MAG: TIGR02452 family protein, partial [Gemmatimonadetes bacterium]|nr:TIGR02452 family protein [Gemmatimonadota bacterium]